PVVVVPVLVPPIPAANNLSHIFNFPTYGSGSVGRYRYKPKRRNRLARVTFVQLSSHSPKKRIPVTGETVNKAFSNAMAAGLMMGFLSFGFLLSQRMLSSTRYTNLRASLAPSISAE